jgi:Predicted transcriptional regulators
MGDLIRNLTSLGLKEYEARVYAGLVGLGEGNARQIHEVSRVPRPRVYDILQSLEERGCVEVRQGTPLLYRPVDPVRVIADLSGRIKEAARESVEALETISIEARQNFSPIWYLKGDWSIRRNLTALVGDSRDVISFFVIRPGLAMEYRDILGTIRRGVRLKILFPAGADDCIGIPGAELFPITQFCPLFTEKIYKKIFAGEIRKERNLFRFEGIVLSDDNEMMIIYDMNGERMSVIVTLPFITGVQGLFLEQMCHTAAADKSAEE